MNLAVLMGASCILLLGYDMKPGPNGELHWHEDHVTRNPVAGQLAGWARRYETMLPDLERAGVEVINVTPGSAINCFPRARLEEVL